MVTAVRARNEIPARYTWNVESVFPSGHAWEDEMQLLEQALPDLERFRGHLGYGPDALLEWLNVQTDLFRRLARAMLYASMRHNVDTTEQEPKALLEQAQGLTARAGAAAAFAEPEILDIGRSTLDRWMHDNPDLAVYAHYLDRLEGRREHVRSPEVEEVLSLAQEPFTAAASIHRTLTDTDLKFAPARMSSGDAVEITQGTYNALLTDADREVRRTAWESYSDAHLAFKNTMAGALASGVKRDVFYARSRRYASSLEAALRPNHIPIEVFHNLIDTYRRNLPVWHRYWRVRREALDYDTLHVYDIKAPLSSHSPEVPFENAVEWIVEGMRPLGNEYADTLRRGVLDERWVDVYPNRGKRSGAYSSGVQGTYPFILMSYTDDLFSLSTLAHELGHSMHNHFSTHTQPFAYTRYGLFLAETASNFNQVMVRAHLQRVNQDRDFQIALIEEAMSNFHRYFFIMPALARFELEIHRRAERGEGLTADGMIDLMAELFREGYGDEVEFDRDRIGITWAEFSGHLYANFYVYQYATGISGAHALAQGILDGKPGAAEKYIEFLKAGGSLYPLEALKLAGVDMTSPEPVEQTFGVLSSLVERLETLTGKATAKA